MNQILYCILHTHKYRSRYKNITESWGKDQNTIFYADYTDEKLFNIVKVTDADHYHSNEEKNINVFKTLTNNDKYKNYDWYFFCDDDTFVNTDNLIKLIDAQLDINSIYGKIGNSWPNDPSLYYCSGGAGYLVSNKILFELLGNAVNYKTGYSDVSVGINCINMNIKIRHIDGFNAFPPFDTRNMKILSHISNEITFHYIKDYETMTKLYLQTKRTNENR